MCTLLRRAAHVALLILVIVGLVLSGVPPTPVFADASVCASPGFVLQRAPLTNGLRDDAVAALPRFADSPVHPQINTAEISVSMTASPNPVIHGNTLTYTILVNNTGPDAAQTLQLTDTLPTGTTFVSLAEPSGCWNCTTPAVGATGTVSCSNPGLASGSSDQFDLVVLVTSSVPAGVPLQNTASITASVIDPVGGDLDSTTNTTVLALTPTPTLTPTVTATPTITPTATSTAVSTATPTAVATGTPLPATATLTPTVPALTATATVTPVATVTATVPPVRSSTDDTDKPKGKSEAERRSDDHTNQHGRDDYHTEGNVVGVYLDAVPPYAEIATRDGIVQVMLPCTGGCPPVRPGDYIQVDGVKENEALFFADDISITRDGQTVR